jgi:hypothetical protein
MEHSALKAWARGHWRDAVALALFAIATIALTWPLVTRLSSHLPGRGDDLLVHYWNGWRTKLLFRRGGELFYTDLLYYPAGVSLLYANFSWMNIGMWLVFEPLLGGIAAFNALYLLNLLLCALGMYALVRYLARSRGAAFVAGLVHAFWPYRLFEIDHPNLITTQWLPLFLLFFIRMIREDRKWQHAVLAAVFITLTGYARWQLLVLSAVTAGLYVLYSLWFERGQWNGRLIQAIVLMVALAALLMAAPTYPIIRGQLTRSHPEDLFVESIVPKQTDLLAYVVPPHNHPLEGLFKGLEYAEGWSRAWYSNAYLGYVVIALAALGIGKTRRMAWFWSGLAIVSWLLALGPALRFNKHIYSSIPLPYTLVADSLPIRIMREPRRFNMLLAIPVSVAAGYGVRALHDRLRRMGTRTAVSVGFFIVIVALICLDYSQVPVQTFDVAVSPFYETLSEVPARSGLLNLPTGRDRSPYYMLCQTVHGKPIVEGSVARPPREAKAFIEDNPFLLYLRDNRMMNPDYPDVSRQLKVLADAGIPYLIINEPWAFPWEKENWRTYITYDPVYSDPFISVYRTDPAANRDFELAQEMIDGVGLTKVISSTESLGPETLMDVAVMWGTSQAQREDFSAELALVDETGQPQQVVAFPPVSNWPTSEWPADTLARGCYTFRVDPRLPGGTYILTLSLVRPDTGEPIGEPAIIREGLRMDLPPRVFRPPPMNTQLDARFGETLSLLGYDLIVDADELEITLHWQALLRMDVSYKFFVHLYEAINHDLVAQADVVPRDWTYPTNWWEAGEVVSDGVRLPLDDVRRGAYDLAVGAYDPKTGERFPVRGGESVSWAPDALVLERVSVP